MKRRIAVLLTVVVMVTMAMPQIVLADSEKGDKTYPFQTGVLPYSAQMEDETSVRVMWHNLTDCKGFVLSWKKTGSEKELSVRIDDPKAKTYVVTGLEPNADYDFRIKGILTSADGSDMLTEPFAIQGSTYVHAPEYGACVLAESSITSYWHVKEQYSNLKIYRADSKDGPYELIEIIEAGGNYDGSSEQNDCQYVRFTSVDFNVEDAETYYYKAQAEGTVGEKIYSSQMSEAVALSAKNEIGRFYTKLQNKRNAYTKQIRIKLTSDEANYTTYLKGVKSLYYYKNRKHNKRIVNKTEYSRDGKKYYTLKNKNVAVKAGESIYLRITTKSRYWLSNSLRQAEINFNVKYNRPSYAGRVDNAELYIGRFDSHGQINTGGIIDAYNDGEGSPRDPVPEPFYTAFYGQSYDEPEPQAEEVSGTSVMLNWKSVSHAESYAVRYGTTKKSVDPHPLKGNKPIVVPKYQVQSLIDGLKKGMTYYFSVVSCANPDGTDPYDEAVGNIIKWDGKEFTRM